MKKTRSKQSTSCVYRFVLGNKIIFFSLLSSLIFLIDISLKQFVRKNNIYTNNGLVDFTYTTNTGSLFSLFANASNINLFFIILSVIALGIVIYLFATQKEMKYKFSLSLLIAGILGNLHDRIFHGAVVDFINLHFWPIFNIADSAIVIGVIILIIYMVKEEIDNYKKK